jgi:leucyl aminopeptidase (aminopeptidase T)
MSFKMMNLMKTARKLMETCMGVKNGENVLVLTDTAMDLTVAESIASAVSELDGEPLIVVIPPIKVPNTLPRAVAEALKGSDVYVMAMSRIAGVMSEPVRTAMLEYGTREMAATGLTPDKMTDPAIADVDYEDMTNRSRRVFGKGIGKTMRITSESGCDFTAELADFFGMEGIARDIGQLLVLPSGQPAWTALLGKADGVLVFDSFPFMFQKLSAPIKVTVKKSWITKIEGGKEASTVESYLKGAKNGHCIGEIGLGMNPYAKIGRTPPLTIFEETRAKGSLVIGIGNQLGFGLRVASPIHQDGVTYKPTIEIDREVIVDKGEIKI